MDFADIRGHHFARRAMEIAAAGTHNVLLVGPPGSGRTMLARRVPGILAPDAPFRAPHHTCSAAGLLGDRKHVGEFALAQGGVLFLDEATEFSRLAIDGIVTMLTGEVDSSRVSGNLPAGKPLLICAADPCPCGYVGTPRCRCTADMIERHLGRLAPLRATCDICIRLEAVDLGSLADAPPSEPSAAIAARVAAARVRQIARQDRYNAQLPVAGGFEAAAMRAINRMRESMAPHAHSALSRVARTIADLDDSDFVREAHVIEASQFIADG